MTKLNQLVAIEKGVKSTAERTVTDAYHKIQKSSQLLSGISRVYRPKDDDGDQLPPESTLVQIRAEEVLANTAEALTRLFDVTLTKDVANTQASASVTVGGNMIVANAPVPFLLFLEKQLDQLRVFVSKLPTLDPAEVWSEGTVSAVYQAAPVQTTRTKKIPRNHVKAEATDRHPAQVDVFFEDVIVGTWTTIKTSGAVPAQRVEVLLRRIDALQDAVKMAREEANSMEITDRHMGRAIFEYLLA